MTPFNEEPFAMFHSWYQEARQKQVEDLDMIALATCTKDGIPSVRMLLFKGLLKDRFVFYSNYESRKAKELFQNPKGALLFHWSFLQRQIRIEGVVHKISQEQSDAYWKSRPRESQMTAVCSAQSRTILKREDLESRIREFAESNRGLEIKRPDFWGGYELDPNLFEFWEGHENRFHERTQFSLEPGNFEDQRWSRTLLAP